MMHKLLISKREAAQMLSLSVRTIENLISQHQLIARKVGKRILIPIASIESFAGVENAGEIKHSNKAGLR